MLGAFTGLTVYNFLIDGELIYAIFPDAYGWVGYVIGLFFAFVIMGLFGVLIERVFLRPLTKKAVVIPLLEWELLFVVLAYQLSY